MADRPLSFSEKTLARPLVAHAVAVAGFPILMTTVVAAYIAAISGGTPAPAAMSALIVFAYVVLALLERALPYRDAWLHSQGDLGTDVMWFATNGLLNRVFEPAALAAAAVAGTALSARYGFGLWPGDWPLLAQIVPALLLAELTEYWFHRLMHETDLLWRFHAVHHSAPRLYWMNAVRFHAVDYIIVGIVKLLPLALLGAGVEVLALVNLIAAVHGSYQHANVPVRIGPLNYVFSMTELDRWHHSPDASEANHNYGGTIAFWDLVFGTRFLPTDREPPGNIGIDEFPHFPAGFAAQMASPFRWERTKRIARGETPI